jgi:AraC family transcriptional regulator of adaptative response/methylated-DNA-[protein]-cysteine methyltransferase
MHTTQNDHSSTTIFRTSSINTPLGSMIAIADEHALYLLEFADHTKLERKIERLRKRTNATIITGITAPIISITDELNAYFDGTLKEFKTPLFLFGTNFQKKVWYALTRVPYGATKSYADQAKNIAQPTASRAVANANGANQMPIIIPCHRIINSNGNLGGYGGGIARKQWLLNHEKENTL